MPSQAEKGCVQFNATGYDGTQFSDYYTARIEPIAAAMRRLAQQIQAAEWAGQDAAALRQQLDTLREAKARGEQYSVNF